MSALRMRPLCWDDGDADGDVERSRMNNIPLMGTSANIAQVFGSNRCCSQYMETGEDTSYMSFAVYDLVFILH
jgi:hypothetical protein